MVHRYVLERSKIEDVRVLVVWGPMLDKETEEDARRATTAVSDPRAIHFWTDHDRVAELFQEVLGFEDEKELGWDTYSLYGPGVEWTGDRPPAPASYMHLGKPLPEQRRLDAIALQREIEELLESD